MLAGLLGNIGWKLEDDEAYLGARGIKFYRHPGAHLKQEAGPLDRRAPNWSRPRACSAAASPTSSRSGSSRSAGHLLKKQLLDPHWEKKAREVMALERATLYGLVVYSGRRVDFGRVDPVARARSSSAKALVGGAVGDAAAVPGGQPQAGRAGRGAGAQVAPAGRAGRRRADLRLLRRSSCRPTWPAAHAFERWYREAVARAAAAAAPDARRADAPRGRRHHHATPSRKTVRLGGVDCAATYLHEPGDARDGADGDGAAVRAEPGQRGALRVAGARHAEGQGAGAAEEPAAEAALAASCRCRNRAARLAEALAAPEVFGHGSLTDALLKLVRDADQPGRQARRLQAGHAAAAPVHEPARGRRARPPARHGAQPGRAEGGAGRAGARGVPGAGRAERRRAPALGPGQWLQRPPGGRRQLSEPPQRSRRGLAQARLRHGRPALHRLDLRRAARADGGAQGRRSRWSAFRR